MFPFFLRMFIHLINIYLPEQNWISLSQFDMYDFIIYAEANFIAKNMNVLRNRIPDTRIINGNVSQSNIINLLTVNTTFALSTSGNNVQAKVFPRSGKLINLSHELTNK